MSIVTVVTAVAVRLPTSVINIAEASTGTLPSNSTLSIITVVVGFMAGLGGIAAILRLRSQNKADRSLAESTNADSAYRRIADYTDRVEKDRDRAETALADERVKTAALQQHVDATENQIAELRELCDHQRRQLEEIDAGPPLPHPRRRRTPSTTPKEEKP